MTDSQRLLNTMKNKALKALLVLLTPFLLAVGYYVWFKIPPAQRRFSDAAHGIEIEWMQGYSAVEYRILLKLAGIKADSDITYNVDVYRVAYPSTNAHGERVTTRGLLAIPRTRAAYRGLVSWQHGTTVDYRDLPSAGGLYNGIFPALLFATGGYIAIAPDYIGYEQAAAEYLNARTEANAVFDLIAATHIALPQLRDTPLNPGLYLTGFSQGGHAAMAALQYPADPPLEIRAVASIAGPYAFVENQKDLAFKNALYGTKGSHTLYMAFILHSYAWMYDLPLSELVNATHLAAVETLFDGKHTNEEIYGWINSDSEDNAGIKAQDLFVPGFLADFQAWEQGQTAAPPWLVARLLENAVLAQTIQIPVRLYAGRKDTSVPIAEAVNAKETWDNDAVVLIDLGDFDHPGSAIEALPQIRNWFDEMTN